MSKRPFSPFSFLFFSLWVTGPGRARIKRPMWQSPKRHIGQSAYVDHRNPKLCSIQSEATYDLTPVDNAMYRKGIHGSSTVLFWMHGLSYGIVCLFDSFVPSQSMIEGTISIIQFKFKIMWLYMNVHPSESIKVSVCVPLKNENNNYVLTSGGQHWSWIMLSLHRLCWPPQNIVNGTFRKWSTNGTQPSVAHFKNQAKNAQISIDIGIRLLIYFDISKTS